MDIRTMIANKCFRNAPDAQAVLEEWIESGFGVSVGEDKKLFVPLCCGE